jgi:environmental stress-induced protein Ves
VQLTHLTPAQYRSMPWKNGLGVTTEIARSPLVGDFDWRVSMAQVTTDGPFSTFPGYDRAIVVLAGPGMVLTHHDVGTEASLGLLEPWSFSGDWNTTCVLRDGTIDDFNVISRRDAFASRISVHRIAEREVLELVTTVALIFCVDGSVKIEAGHSVELHRGHSALMVQDGDPGEEFALSSTSSPGTLLRVELHARQGTG